MIRIDKKLFIVSAIVLAVSLFMPSSLFSQGIVVTEETGTVTPHASSIFDVQSTTKGLLIPRMTAAQRLAISTPANGLLVYDLTENQFFYYDAAATSWVKAVGPQGPQGFLSSGTALGNVPYWNGTQWVLSSNNLFHNGSRVGIGTNNPLGKLDIRLADGSDYINVQRIAAGYGPIMDLFGFSTAHRLRIEYLSSSVYNFSVNDANKHIAFNPSGYVGINTGILEPTQKLDVNGNIRLRGHLFDYNNTSGINGQVLTRSTSGLVWANPAGNVNGTGTIGRIAYWSSASNVAALPFMNYNTTNQFVEVTSKTVANDDDPIFEVRNKDGMIVFGVYQTGVRIYVDDSQTKTARGGFAVGGFTNQKDKAGIEYLKVTPDSVRVYIDTDNSKTARGGFAVGGYTTQKAASQEFLRITPDSARIYLKEPVAKTARGGFAVGGYTTGKSTATNFMHLTPENYFIGHESGLNTVPGTVTGLYNTFFGYTAGKGNIHGHSNIFIGYESGLSNVGNLGDPNLGSRNVFLGFRSGLSNQQGSDNIALGFMSGYNNITAGNTISIGTRAGFSNSQQSNNIFIGLDAGYHHSGIVQNSAINNIYIGSAAGFGSMGQSRGNSNVYIGNQSGMSSTTAEKNVFVGFNSGFSITTGSSNVFIGEEAGYSNTDGSSNTFLGKKAGVFSTIGVFNVYIGDNTGAAIQTGHRNTFVGTGAGQHAKAGSRNVFLGFEAGKFHNAGDDNIFMGNAAGHSNSSFSGTSERNVIMGINAGLNLKDAVDNIFIGHKAGEGYNSGGITGDYNVIIGERAGNSLKTGNSNIFLGTQAGAENTDGHNNVFLGYRSGMKNKTANSNVAIGYDAARENETGAANVLIGNNVASLGKIGNWNVLIGNNTAASADFTGAMNVMIGSDIGGRLTNAQRNVFIGDLVGIYNTSGSGNIFLGANAGYSNTSANNNIFIGTNSGNKNTTGQNNVFLGYRSGQANTEGYSNVLLGDSVGISNNSGYRNVFIGHLAGKSNTFGNQNIYIGYQAGLNATSASQSVIIGNYAGKNLTAGQNLFIGDYAGELNQGGTRNTFVGFFSGGQNVSGWQNAYFGQFSGNKSTGDFNTYIGYYAGGENTGGVENAFLGNRSGLSSGSASRNVYLGYEAGAYNTGSDNVFIGHQAGPSGSSSSRLYIGTGANPLIYGHFVDKRVGIETTSPTATLDVNGTIRIRGGSPGVNKVLTSDANGVASWQNIAAESTTASNGLSRSTFDIRLGGTLSQNTSISLSGYSLTFSQNTNGQNAGYFSHTSIPPISTKQWSVYGYMRNSSDNNGSGYAENLNNSGAIKGYNDYGGSYSFGVAGWNFNDNIRTAGTFGAVYGGTYWGALGYKNSSSATYGVYGSNAYASGAGKGEATGVGVAGYGSLFGSWFRGEIYGTLVKGERLSLYVDGKAYTNDVIAQVNDGKNNEKFITYVPTSMTADVYMKGTGQLVDGKAVIKFDKQYESIISDKEPIIVTVTPIGKSNGIYLESIKGEGFEVAENGEGKSNVTFNWIAVATRKGYENPSNPEEILDPAFDENMQGFMFNDGDTKNSAKPVWWDGKKLNFSPLPKNQNVRSIELQN
jgi:hypothetical protein